uniref:Zinc finger, CCHC-type n=1 Tax=Tanacetum cinerariifolium TaxID=118510 RepID=A0A6L2LP64_TANCI|nr:zinc finger, CCHC-type [Tanacetum cinerariifolium]
MCSLGIEWIVRFSSIYRLRISWIPIGIVVAVLKVDGSSHFPSCAYVIELLHLDYCFVRLVDGSMVLKVRRKGYERHRQVKDLEFFDCPGPRQGVEELTEQRVKRIASINTRLNIKKLDGNIVQKHRGSKQVGFKQLSPGVETGVHGVHDEKNVWFEVKLQGAQRDHKAEVFQSSIQQCMKRWVAKHLGVAGIQQQNGLVNKTNVTLFAKTHVDMLGFFGLLASIKQEMLDPVKVKCIFLRYRKCIVGNKLWRLDDVTSKLVLYRNMGFNESEEYKKTFFGSDVASSQEVQTQDLIYYHLASDREQHSTHELFSYREDSNEAASAVAEPKKIYAHDLLIFNNTVACKVIFKWKAGLKDDIDAQSDVYVLGNGCKKYSDDNDVYYWKYTPGKFVHLFLYIDDMVFLADARLRFGLPRVCWIKQREMYLTLLEGHSILSLKGSLLGDCDVEKNGKWSYIYAVGSQEYQMVCTRHDIASADVCMLDEFDRGLQTNIQVLWILTTPWALSTTEAAYMTLTKAANEAIWLKGLAIESGFELKIVAGIATSALLKAILSLRFQHWLKLLRIEEG